MIASQFFGHPKLSRNLGNQLFELASLIGLSKRYNTQLNIPFQWQYADFFTCKNAYTVGHVESFITIEEPAFHYCGSFFDKFEKIIQTEEVNLEGFLQSPLYWQQVEDQVKSFFSFNAKLINQQTNYLQVNNINPAEYVAISVRRGDFVTDPNHFLLPIEYYINAYKKYFNHKNIIVFSDDINWCKINFNQYSHLIHFPVNKNAIEQLCLMSLFDNFIISNSTFSWWGAYLSAAINKKVVRPIHHFDGELKIKNNIKDHYPVNWMAFNFEE